MKSLSLVVYFSRFTTVRPAALAPCSTRSAPPVPKASVSCRMPTLVSLVSSLMYLTMAAAAMESSGRTRNSQGLPCLVRVALVPPIIVGTP